MAPQGEIPVSANVLGTIGTVFWCIQLIPQIWYNWKQKKTDGLPGLMMFTWAVSAVPFGVYAIVQEAEIQYPYSSPAPGLLSSGFDELGPGPDIQSVHTHPAHPGYRQLLTTSSAPGESGQHLHLPQGSGPYSRGVEWPMTLVGIISAVLLAGGLIPPYFEIAKRNGRVVGINFIFLSIDWLGAFFSLMALVAQRTFDVLGGVQYIVV
ncbi:MAG: hypothetical protein Q9171_006807 [Xanthocarpia ochracea]